DHFAGRVLALLTRERLVVRARRFGRVTFEVGVDANPVHFAAALDLLLADHRNVVLGHTGRDAHATPGAGVEVDRHAPLVAVVLVLRIERDIVAGGVPHVRHDGGFVAIFGSIDHAD